jgi:hypothetical protein
MFCRRCCGSMECVQFQGALNKVESSTVFITPNLVRWVCNDCEWVVE